MREGGVSERGRGREAGRERDVVSMDEELAQYMRMKTRRYTQVVLLLLCFLTLVTGPRRSLSLGMRMNTCRYTQVVLRPHATTRVSLAPGSRVKCQL